MNIESDHFKSLEELIDTIKMWVKNEEEYYDRWFGLNEMNILVKEIERLKKENNILKENAEHNDKVVDNVNWENMLLKKRIDKAIEYIDQNIRTNYFKRYDDDIYKMCNELMDILRGEDNE